MGLLGWGVGRLNGWVRWGRGDNYGEGYCDLDPNAKFVFLNLVTRMEYSECGGTKINENIAK